MRKAAYSLAGAFGSLALLPIQSNAYARYPVMISVPWQRLRVRIRNVEGRTDTALPATFNIAAVHLGIGSRTSYGAYLVAPTLIGGAGSVTGYTEYVTDWFTPTDPALAVPSELLMLTIGYTNTPGALAAIGSSRMWLGAGSTSGASVGVPEADFSISLFEVIIEYEFDGDQKLVMFIGHSGLDAGVPNDLAGAFLGQANGYPQQWARRSGGVAVVNAFSGAVLTDWGPSSPKWDRFPDVVPEAILTSLVTNNLNSVSATVPAVQALWHTFMDTLVSKYPGIPVFHLNETPYNASGAIEANRQIWNAWIGGAPRALAGVLDVDRQVRDPSAIYRIDPQFDSGDVLHVNVRGWSKMADLPLY